MEELKSNIYGALAKAQAEFRVAVKNKRANYGLYADLSSCLDAVRPALNRYGLFVNQNVTSNALEVTVETVIYHESGESISSGTLTIPVSGKGMNVAQQMGSALTYARRYSLCSFLGIVGDDDDDGQSSGVAEQHSPKTASPELIAKAEAEANKGRGAFVAYWKSLDVASRDSLKSHMSALQALCATADKAKQSQDPAPDSGITQKPDGSYSW